MKKFLIITACLFIGFQCSNPGNQGEFKFLDSDLPVEERVNDLIGQMTLDEKISQLNYNASAIERLGIPAYNWWNECLHGVGRAGMATVFPQAIGMAASWNKDLMGNIGTVISDEARAKHHYFLKQELRDIYYGLTFWTPNINIFRDPRWGRGQETYGEDPYLTSHLAIPFIRGLQGNDDHYLKVVATSKHYAVHSGPEHSRHSINIDVSNVDLYETYLPAFEATVKEGQVASVMCAYNRFRDEACCGSNLLLQSILRDEWGFQGYVVSDCGAISDFYRQGAHEIVESPEAAAAMAFRAGTDLNCGNTSPYLKEAVEQGLINESEIDEVLKRLFTARFKLGMFDLPQDVPYASIPYEEVRDNENLKTALQSSRESIVLLKNDNILPFGDETKNIAVIGPLADNYRVLLGNYHGTSDNLYTLLRGIREHVEKRGGKVSYSAGCKITEGVANLNPVSNEFLLSTDQAENGLNASYYDNREFAGDPAIERIDHEVDFWWYDETPVTRKIADEFSVVWEGFIKPPESGEYVLGINAGNAAQFYFEDSLMLSFDNVHHPLQQSFSVELEEGNMYPIRIKYFNYGNDPQAHLLWGRLDEDLSSEAVALARQSDAVVLCMGLSPYLEGEEMPVKVEGFSGGDRTDIRLPATQLALMKQLAATGKPMVLVLMGGSAIAVNYADQYIPGILHAWYPGEFGGKAIAEVLFGETNPSGKLPVTFYRSVTDLPDFEDYNMESRTYKYFKGDPLYPFGHGLSYTRFGYSELAIEPLDANSPVDLKVKVKVKNSGDREGFEVVQLYLKHLDSNAEVPQISLEGFEKINLRPGEEREVQFTLTREQLAVIDENGRKVIEPGTFEIFAGGKQPGMKGNADAETTQVISMKARYSGPMKVLED